MEKRLRSSLQSSSEEFLKSASKLGLKSAKPSLKTLIHTLTSATLSSSSLSNLTFALHQSISQSISKYKILSNPNAEAGAISPQTPPTKRTRRSTRNGNNVNTSNDETLHSAKQSLVETLHIYAYILHLCVTHPAKLFSPEDLLPAVNELHDNLVLFESDSALLSEIAGLCEEWWKEELVGRENLVTQSLPFLLSRSLTLKKKIDVHRVYSLREAFNLFDFEDESIEDLKHLLIRCSINPLYLKSEDGRKFIAFMFGLSLQLVKEALAMFKSQIPFGRNSMLEAYGEIVFRAWKNLEGEVKEETEKFVQGLIDSAIHARTGEFSASIRRVLGAFISHRTVDGVEKLLFKLAEPVLFRSLQVANSNVRQNALHLLLDLFPFEDPEATKEVKDTFLHKQFFLLEKLLMDETPDIRVVAVEGCFRILRMFWEIVPSQIITKLIREIFDQMTRDECTEVRLSSVNGIIYLFSNHLSHELLKVLLPRIGHLIQDSTLSIRAALIDLLLCLKEIRNYQFHKVVPLDVLLSTLAKDQTLVARKITKLLTPTYFPMKLNQEEACNRFLAFMKRNALAGARFCEYALSEGASMKSLKQLFTVLINTALSPVNLNAEQIDGLLIAGSHLCKDLVTDTNYKTALQEDLTNEKLKRLFSSASTPRAQSCVCNIVALVSPNTNKELFEECMGIIVKCADITNNKERQEEIRSAHKMIIACNWFDDMLEAVTGILQKTVTSCHVRFVPETRKHNVSSRKRSKSKHAKSSNITQSFKQDYAIAEGLAWQIKDLLVSETTQKAILSSMYCGDIFYALKIITEVSILQCLNCDDMSSSSISTYGALSLHISLNNVNTNGKIVPDLKIRCFPDTARSYPEKTVLDLTIDHLFKCTSELFQAIGSERSGFDANKQNRIPNLMKMLTSALKFIVDATTMDLISHSQESSFNFTMEYIKFIVFNVKKCSGGIKGKSLSEIFLCLKSTFSYAAKLLNIVLKSSLESPLQECYDLANQLLDLIVIIEESLGYKYASRLLSVIKPWVPDIILGLCSRYLVKRDEEESHGIISSCPLWVSNLAKIEVSDCEETDLIAFKKLMEIIISQVISNHDVLDAVGCMFFKVSIFGLENDDFDLVLGLVRFISVKMIKCDDEHDQGELKLTLANLDELYHRLGIEAEKTSKSEDEKEKLFNVIALLKPIFMFYFNDEGRNEMDDDE